MILHVEGDHPQLHDIIIKRATLVFGNYPVVGDYTVQLQAKPLRLGNIINLFGWADRAHNVCYVSSEQFKERAHSRVLVTALHELGHLLGLDHCSKPQCLMWHSKKPIETDLKGRGHNPLCPDCTAKLEKWHGQHRKAV